MTFIIYLIASYTVSGYIAAASTEVRVFPTSLYPCRTSENCTRYLRCTASGAIKWHYPNSTVITSTHSTTKLIQGNTHKPAVLILTIHYC